LFLYRLSRFGRLSGLVSVSGFCHGRLGDLHNNGERREAGAEPHSRTASGLGFHGLEA
jgi:hypothetical protein